MKLKPDEVVVAVLGFCGAAVLGAVLFFYGLARYLRVPA